MGEQKKTTAVPESFWSELRQVYISEGFESEYETEARVHRKLLPAILSKLPHNYQLHKPVRMGGAGVICTVRDIDLSALQVTEAKDVLRALKWPRPLKGSVDPVLNRSLVKELRTLATISHPNVIKLYFATSTHLDKLEIPFYVMDYIEDATTAKKFVAQKGVSFEQFVSLLKDIAFGVACLFDRSIVHNDIKPSNVLVDSGKAIVSDLGSALKTDVPLDTQITFTGKYAHPEKIAEAAKTGDSNRYRRQIKDAGRLVVWDIYSLGCTILELLEIYSEANRASITPYNYRYLKLLGSRMLDARGSNYFGNYHFPPSFYKETACQDMTYVLLDLQKLTEEYSPSMSIPELNFHSTETVQGGMFGPTPTSPELLKLLTHPTLRRLNSISQLGLILFLYPGATHSRGEHSFGVFSNVARILDALWHDPVNPMFRQIMSPGDLRACLLAGLLHDVGQFPLAHDLEDADDSFFDHELLAEAFFDEEIDGEMPLSEFIDNLWPAAKNEPKMSLRVKNILAATHTTSHTHLRDQILHSIIDGPIDADKLDYVPRDGHKLGIPYGLGIDFQRLIKVITIVHKIDGNRVKAGLGIHENGKMAAESVAFARYAMFGAVYWHRTSRAIKAMLSHAVWNMLGQTLSSTSMDLEETRDGTRSPKDKLKQDFRRLVLSNQFPPLQRHLFGSDKQTESMNTPTWPGINSADLRMLGWIWQGCDKKGRTMLDDLADRRLYKRVVVISQEGRDDLWARAVKFSAEATFEQHLKLDQELLVELYQLLNDMASGDNLSSTYTVSDALKQLGEAEQRCVPVLIDIPRDRTRGLKELKFFEENDRWKHSTDEYENVATGRSKMWNKLADIFTGSVGKIRIFAHPTLVGILRTISQERLEDALSNALNTVVG
jgi:HD superfamily phosphohydrolase